jgi:hypothetical protein
MKQYNEGLLMQIVASLDKYDSECEPVGEGAKDAYLIRGHEKLHWKNAIPQVVFASQSEALYEEESRLLI